MVQVNAVEERTDVERDGTLELCAGERGLQGRHVALDDGGVEAEVGGAEEEIVGAQLATQGGQGLGEGVARVLSVAFGPKEGEQAIAAHTALSPRRKYGEQGQLAALRRRPGDQTALAREREPAERAEPQGHSSADFYLTSGCWSGDKLRARPTPTRREPHGPVGGVAYEKERRHEAPGMDRRLRTRGFGTE